MTAESTTAINNWTGTTSDDWTVDSNWSSGAAPTADTEAHLDSATSQQTVLGVTAAATGVCGQLHVGSVNGAISTLTIQNDGAMSTSDVYLGENGGVGVLVLQDGASLTTRKNALVGLAPGGPDPGDGGTTGAVVVKGGSRWAAGEQLGVGWGGPGSLNIIEGATVTTVVATVGASEGSDGELVITAGGVLETKELARGSGTGRAYFDNGTVRATGGRPDWGKLLWHFSETDVEINGGGLTIDDGGFVVGVSSRLTGDGGVTKTGSGTLVLVGEHTYLAGTTVKAGSLHIGDGGLYTRASIIGDVALEAGASLVFARSDADYTFGGLISGAGGVQQRGGDNLFFIRDHTYTGGTTISSGTLVLGDNGETGSIGGDVRVEAGAALAFYRANDHVFNGVITGQGGVSKDGAGATVLAGDHTYTGGTTVLAGTLVVNGSIASPVTVNAGGILAGTGTIAKDVASAGTIAPGPTASEVGTLTIGGTCTGNGGTLAVKATLGGDASPADLLRITGDAVKGSGSIELVVTNLGGPGAQTTGDGIKIVEVGGASAPDLFVLGAKVTAGTHVYELFHGGLADPGDGNWYLRTVDPA